MAFKMKGMEFGEGTGSSPFNESFWRGGKKLYKGGWGTMSREYKKDDDDDSNDDTNVDYTSNISFRDIFPKIDPDSSGSLRVFAKEGEKRRFW